VTTTPVSAPSAIAADVIPRAKARSWPLPPAAKLFLADIAALTAAANVADAIAWWNGLPHLPAVWTFGLIAASALRPHGA
jgi:hypothetical protein